MDPPNKITVFIADRVVTVTIYVLLDFRRKRLVCIGGFQMSVKALTDTVHSASYVQDVVQNCGVTNILDDLISMDSKSVMRHVRVCNSVFSFTAWRTRSRYFVFL